MKLVNNIGKNRSPLSRGIFNGVKHLIDMVVDMERRGVSEESRHGEIDGKKDDGRAVKVKYNYGVKIGLDDFVKKLKNKNLSHGTDRISK